MGSASVPPTPAEVQASYGYSPTTARLATIGDATSAFRYDYLTNSSLIESVTATAGAVHTVTNTWELNRNVLSSKQNKAGTEILSKFDYSVNQLGQRESVATSGTAFPAVPSWAWGYDALGQVISANHGANNNFDRAYQYDTIGNRIETVDGATTVTGTPNYTANPLNQYTVANGVTLPVTPAPAPYDFDGNLRFDGGVNKDDEARAYSWDAENRLIEVKRVEGDMLLTRYKYDAQSRLISRTQSPISNPQSTLFIYDAWNRIAEYVADASGHALKRSYLFGMDLSGNMQGAGGVGGLLLLSDHSAAGTPSYYPTFDGNGNVSEYIDSIGVIKAHFEYDPFGRTLPTVPLASEDATLKATLDYRFSTKPIDSVTGWFYYGYRWYAPATGRWPSRDPVKEKGGLNLYGFVGNNGVNKVDHLGLLCCWVCNDRVEIIEKEHAEYPLDVSHPLYGFTYYRLVDDCSEGGFGCKGVKSGAIIGDMAREKPVPVGRTFGIY